MSDSATAAAEHHPVETLDVAPVNDAAARQKQSLYKKREKIYPKLVHGRFRKVKWIGLVIMLGIYYILPWLRWDRGPGAPDQAVLLDLPERKFYFFFIEVWPQEVYLLTGLLILAALVLFLVTALFGRVWCGYACPQTVWTDLFIFVERAFEGDRSARIRLDKHHMSFDKIWRKGGKHLTWLLIAVATGGAWVFYFADAPTLMGELLTFDAPVVAYAFIGILTFTTYWLGGSMREQVCTYMCPWPRIQGALFDDESLLVTYREQRGEPRGPLRKGKPSEAHGDCIDCKQCVAVCPMGIDIRNGPQLECITCALCIDACDSVMDKIGKPRGLIAYDSYVNAEQAAKGEERSIRLIRPRTILYAVLILLVSALLLLGLVDRGKLELNVLHDRNPLFVTLSDGEIRNGYTLKVINKEAEQRTFQLSVEGLEGAEITMLGDETPSALTVPAGEVLAYRVFVAAPRAAIGGEVKDITFVLRDPDGKAVTAPDVFRGPRN